MTSYHAKARDRAAGKERPDAVPARDAVADELVLRPVVRRQLDGGAHGRPQGGGVHAAHEPAELLRVPDASQRVPRAFVIMLGADGENLGVGLRVEEGVRDTRGASVSRTHLHTSLDEEERVSDRC